MRLSISNIAWSPENDSEVYRLMKENGYTGLEIAPTRIFSVEPYNKNKEASFWAEELKAEYGFTISSMQSILYGRAEMMFGTEAERKALLDYAKKAVIFASVIGCRNLVFGCPRNRYLPEGADKRIAVSFFRDLGDYAAENNTVVGIEANPTIYNTNYINDTGAAFELIDEVNSKGFRLNLDVGTMIYNKENVRELTGKVSLINHIHISEPGLKPIEKRKLHSDLKKVLESEDYKGYVSIEMSDIGDILHMSDILEYVRNSF